MKFSFVIPVHENVILLDNCLAALNNQAGFRKGDYEVVVVDDSRERHRTGVAGNPALNYTLRYITPAGQTEYTRSHLRNIGWQAAAGEIIIFIDADIIVPGHYLQQVACSLQDQNRAAVIGLRLMLPAGAAPQSCPEGDLFAAYPFNRGNTALLEDRHVFFGIFSYNLSHYRYPWLYVYSCNLALPRSLLAEIRGFDENFKGWGFEDVELGYRLYRAGVKLLVNSKMEVLHQNHGDNIIEKINHPATLNNARYLLEKHGQTMEVTEEILMRKQMYDPEQQHGRRLIRKRLTVAVSDPPEKAKTEIRELLKTQGVSLIIDDHSENPELEKWIQLLEPAGNALKYYPVGRRISDSSLLFRQNGASGMK